MTEIPGFPDLRWHMPIDCEEFSRNSSQDRAGYLPDAHFLHADDLTPFKIKSVDIASFVGYIGFYSHEARFLARIRIGFSGLAIATRKSSLSSGQASFNRWLKLNPVLKLNSPNVYPLKSTEIRKGVANFKKLFGKGQSIDFSENLEWSIGDTYIKTFYDVINPTSLYADMTPRT